MSSSDDRIIEEFLIESHENLDQLDRDLVTLERKPASREVLGRVFRAVHTLKGTCGFLGFARLQSIAHAGESLLSRLRDGELALTPEMANALLAMVDAIRIILASIESTGSEGEGDAELNAAVIGALQRFSSPKATPASEAAPTSRRRAAPAVGTPPASDPSTPAAPAPKFTEPQSSRLFDPLVEAGRIERHKVDEAERLQKLGDPRRIGEILVDQGLLQPHEVLEALVVHGDAHGGGVTDGHVRVDVGLLDRLMNLVSELVLARNQILQYVGTQDFGALPATSQRLNLITSELQEGIMKTRMQPISTLWNKLPRLVRDVSTACGKDVRLEMDGKDTELDKTVLEAIRDPLLHLVRNAIDHGIEGREIRKACGKPAEGRLLLRAYHEDAQVYIEISDDGAGIPIERIKRKALDRHLVQADRVEHMSDSDWANLIFLPGFSTAQQITNISGRGVGMDVVKSNVEAIGGAVEVQTQPTVGTTIHLRIPLTLAIIPALIVTDGGERYAIPQANLQELVRLDTAAPGSGPSRPGAIEDVHGLPVCRLRGALLPLVPLAHALSAHGAARPSELPAGPTLNLVVLQSDGRVFGLVVDEINDVEEIVVKPLAEHLKSVAGLAGATILGDGRVALILDVASIARHAGVINTGRSTSPGDAVAAGAPERRRKVLLFRLNQERRVALPLERVTRLEEFASIAIERAGGHEVVQYRGEILPVVRVAELLGESPGEPDATMQIVVLPWRGRSIGLIAGRLIDIVEQIDEEQPVASRRGVSGSTVLQDRVTDVLDVDALVANAGLEGFAPQTAHAAGG
jgi:two-component system chemotaxis sensor kinase CheA